MNVMSYDEACNLINDLPKFTTKHTIEESKSFLDSIGNPEKDMRVIHVAGTNGKGSVCTYMESILLHAGLNTGCFISPHLVDMRERVRLNSQMCTKEEFAWACSIINETAKTSFYPTFFEFLFFVAILIFKKHNVDIMILETGLGGRLDATNLIEKKDLCVITSIGLDHMEYLGDSISDIAFEKAGIMRANVPVVFWNDEEATETLETFADERKAISYPLDKGIISHINVDKAGIDFCITYQYDNIICLCLHSKALYQVYNAALAIKALEIWDDKGLLNEGDYAYGIEHSIWEGRMEEIYPHIIVDGAHNVPGTIAFLESVKMDDAKRRLLIYGCMRDKQYDDEIELIADSKLFDCVISVNQSYYRALSAAEISDCFIKYGMDVQTADSVEDALRYAKEYQRTDNDYVYIAGSLYLVGELKGLIR